MSAAAVGRIIVPPRPTQGPSVILPGAVEFSTPVSNPVVHQEPHVKPVSPMTPSIVSPSLQQQQQQQQQPSGSNFMFSYTGKAGGYSTTAPLPVPSYTDPKANEPVYQAFPYQQHQQQQFQQPIYADALVPQPLTPPPHLLASATMDRGMPTPEPRHTITSGSKSSPGYNSSMVHSPSSNEIVQAEYKPGPHAVHHPGAEAPVPSSFEDDLDFLPQQRSVAPASQPTPAFASPVVVSTTSKSSSSSSLAAGAVVPVRAQPVDNSALYVSPPDAWDHDAAPPELDVEGSYIRYRCEYSLCPIVYSSFFEYWSWAAL